MKDNNIYKIVAEFDAGEDKIVMTVFKNSVPIDFNKLPRTEQNKVTALSAQCYVFLDEASKQNK